MRRGLGEVACVLGKVKKGGLPIWKEGRRRIGKVKVILKSYFEELAIQLIQAAAVILHPASAKGHLVTGLTANIRCTSASMSLNGAQAVLMNLTYQCWLSRSPPLVDLIASTKCAPGR